MKAIEYKKYGSPEVLELNEIEKPSPKDNEVLVKVLAASVNAADWHLMRGEPFMARLAFGLFKPKIQILGADVSGKVEAVGKNVKDLKPGDEVFGDVSESGWGGFAEYVCADENAFILKPVNMSFEESAAVPLASVTALQALRDKGEIKQGKKVLINGASGGVGTFAVQIAKYFGAEVTSVCSTGNLEMVRALGADYVIDYTKEDFTKNGKSYDLILAANGYHPILDYKRALSSKGIYVITGGSMSQLYQALLLGPFLSSKNGKKMGNILMKPNKKDLIFMKDVIEMGKVKPVIDKEYSFYETAEAIRYLEEGHARGKVVITFKHDN
ncbi:MAG: NAD(P)-dependent alcohol dehydrogenase [Bacteroidetes bacterium]|nr:NAD(P)-dependent alcohol dehydrogenase [Bacteroidota bacterium]